MTISTNEIILHLQNQTINWQYDIFMMLLSVCLTIGLSFVVAWIVYKKQFSDDSKNTIDKEIILIKAVLYELNELVRNTWENIDASRRQPSEVNKLYEAKNHLEFLTFITDEKLQEKKENEDTLRYEWKIVINKYFSSSLENYLHNARKLTDRIIYNINRIRKMTELINGQITLIVQASTEDKKNQLKVKVILWTRELNIYIYALVSEIASLTFVKERGIINSEYEYLIQLNNDFWSNRENLKKNNKDYESIINKIERDLTFK